VKVSIRRIVALLRRSAKLVERALQAPRVGAEPFLARKGQHVAVRAEGSLFRRGAPPARLETRVRRDSTGGPRALRPFRWMLTVPFPAGSRPVQKAWYCPLSLHLYPERALQRVKRARLFG
jgi:hypothetical protein